jgi:hypothetical protein
MRELCLKRTHSGQGIVEFALVLPLLLLIIFGIIAFAHLFFVYTTVVAASREAARWGSATGTTPSGVARYRDCASIRDAAVRIGALGGVSANQVEIFYDHGPDDVSVHPICPIGGTGPELNLGDRIHVRISVAYQPIVPLVDFPTFYIAATAKRTVLMDLDLGEAPPAVGVVPTVTLSIVPMPDPSATSSKTGVLQRFGILVTASNGTAPGGTLTFRDTSTNQNSSCGASFTPSGTVNVAKECTFTFNSLGAHNLTATFTPGSGYIAPQPANFAWVVSSKLTNTTIVSVSPPARQVIGQGVTVGVQVQAKSPDTGTPNGNVMLYFGNESVGPLALNGSGNVTFSNFKPTVVGNKELVTVFVGNANYGSSQASVPYSITNPIIPLLTPLSNPSSGVQVGQNISFTLHVASELIGVPVPTGTVVFTDNAQPAHTCTANLNGKGDATCTWSYSKAGTFTVTATYSGDTNYSGGYRTFETQVAPFMHNTTMALQLNPTTGFANQPVTISVQVSAPGGLIPTGTVMITGEGGLACPNPITLDGNGRASCTYTYTQVNAPTNQWKIQAEYVSNAPDFKNSSASTNVMINPDDTYITIIPGVSENGFTLGAEVNYTIQVSSAQGGTPTGTVEVTGDGISCSGALSGGALSNCRVRYSEYNTYRVTATYRSNSSAFLDAGPTTFYYMAWPVPTTPPNRCPVAANNGVINFGVSKQLTFSFTSPRNAPQRMLTGVDVYWPNTSGAVLKQISMDETNIFASDGLPPTIAKVTINPQAGPIVQRTTRNISITFDHDLGVGTYAIQLRFSGTENCLLTFRQAK